MSPAPSFYTVPPVNPAENASHMRRAEEMQNDIIRSMTPGRRLEIAQELYETAWQIKESVLRHQNPD